MDLKVFLWEWRFVLALVVAVVLYAVLEWEKFKALAFSAMLQAKRLAKQAVLNSGQEQEDWAVRQILNYLPLRIKVFITEDMVRKAVKFLYHKAKDKLDDGQFNNSI